MENKFSKESGAYLYPTENINGYYDKLDFKDKKVMTVIGASDHIFEAILRGAREVEGFDISINAILFYYLKLAAIKTLFFEDYTNFFFVLNKCFSKKTYDTIRTELNGAALAFWDKIFYNETIEPTEAIKTLLISPKFYNDWRVVARKLSKSSSYMDVSSFYDLKELLKDSKIDIKLRDIYDIDSINGVYDYIILSNIFEYHDTDDFKKLIEQYRQFLTPNGSIIVGYAYHDIDLSKYPEYEIMEVPSRYMLQEIDGAPYDHIMKTGNKK